MGGIGSGRYGWRRKAEDCRALDIGMLRRAGCLRPGHAGHLQWTRDGQLIASVGVSASDEGVRLVYRHGSDRDDVVDYLIPLVWVACTRGGHRPYFRCPGSRNRRPCGRRAARLFKAGRYFLCRHCHGLAYASQSERPCERLVRRANKLRRSLGGESRFGSAIPPRRKGQWRRTYEAKVERIWQLEDQAEEAFAASVGLWAGGESLDDLFG
jgi:hypothetical protein